MKPDANFNAHSLKPGQWTDDTAMGLCLADSLIVKAGYDGSEFTTRLWNWYICGYNNAFRHESEESRLGDAATLSFYKEAMIAVRGSIGAGGGVKRALGALKEGETPPAVIDSDSPEDGNAGLIRLAPVPVFCCGRPVDDCMEMARSSCMATSSGQEVAEASVFMAYLMHAALHRSDDQTIQSFLENVVAAYQPILEDRSEEPAVRKLLQLLNADEPLESTEACWNWKEPRLQITRALENRGAYSPYRAASTTRSTPSFMNGIRD